MGKLNRPKVKYCECINNCGTKIPLHCHFATGHNKGKRKPLSPPQICACGKCGLMTKPGNRYIKGHSGVLHRGDTRSEESKRKQSETRIERDIRPTQEIKAKISLSLVGTRSGPNHPMYNHHHTEEAKISIGIAATGRIFSEEECKKRSDRMRGENNPSFVDGSHSLGIANNYSYEWKETLKEAVWQRDNYRCKICDKKQEDIEKRLHVHHVNYKKDDCSLDNLVALCRSCHSKTNYNRPYWISFFKAQQERQSLVSFWVSQINPNITGSGYIPDPYQERSQQLSI
jgi:hypothetical protein